MMLAALLLARRVADKRSTGPYPGAPSNLVYLPVPRQSQPQSQERPS
jgi:hypothetical protein